MTDDDTYDIELTDASLEDYAAILGGLGVLTGQLVQIGEQERAIEVNAVMKRLVRENPEATRTVLLDMPEEVNIPPDGISEETLDLLDLEIRAGRLVEAGSFKDIDVE